MMTENLSTNMLLDAVATPVLICENHTILFANHAAETLMGHAYSQILKQPIDEFIYTTSSKAFTQWYDQQLLSNSNEALDVRLFPANHNLVWVKMMAVPTIFEGKAAHMLTMQDITRARKTETDLFLSQAYRDMLMDNNPDIVAMTDASGKLIYASPSIYDSLGYKLEDLIDQKWTDKIHPDDLPLVIKIGQEARQAHQSIRIEVRVRNQAGDYLWYEGMVGMVAQHHDDQIMLISTLRNIHKHKMNELALLERERRLRLITDNMQDIVLEIDPNGVITYASPSSLTMMGRDPEELVGSAHLSCVHPDDVPTVLEYFSQAMVNQIRTPCELRFQHKDGHYLWYEIVYKLVKDEQGNLKALVISGREIMSRRQFQEALQENQRLLQQIMDTAPSGIYLYDVPTGQSLFHNQQSILGYTEADVKAGGENFFFNRVHPDDREIAEDTNRRLEQAKDGEVIISEFRVKHADGQWRWHQFHDTVFARHSDGKPKQYLRTGYEITERKQAEEALKENQHLLQQITDVAPVGIYIYDVKRRCDIYHNKRAVEDTGLVTIEESLPEEFYLDYIHPDDIELHEGHKKRLTAAKDGEIIESEHRLRVPDGTYRWFYFRDVVFKRDEDGKPSQFLGSMQDITERRESDQALRQSQDLLKKITDTAPFGVYIYDVKQRRDVYHNQRLRTEIEPEGMNRQPTDDFYADFVHPDDLEAHEKHREILMAARDGEVIESELRARTGHGNYLWLYFRDIVFARDAEGKPSQFLGSMQDITERKEAEQELRESKNLLKQITDMVPLDIYIYDVDLKRNVFFNRSENMGYPLSVLDSQVSGDFYEKLVHPEDIERHRENGKRLLSAHDGELLQSEYRMKHASGEWRWYDFRDIVFARHADGTPRQFLGSVQDITVRKETEAALRHSQDMLQQVTSTVPLDIFIFDVDLNKSIFANRDTHLGLDATLAKDADSDFFRTLVHKDDLALYDDFVERLVNSPDNSFVEGIFRMQRADGTWMWRHYRNIVLHRHTDGTPSQYLGTVEDITQRKIIEDELRQNRHTLQKVTETVPIQIFIYDYDLQCNIFENRSSDLGFASDVLSNASEAFFTELVHPDDRQHHDEIMEKLLTVADGEMLENEFRMRDAAGVYAWRYYRYIPFARHPDGSLKQFLGTILNIDDRKRTNEALRENEEKLRLITDNIHDLIALTDDKLHYRYASPSHLQILGYKPEDLVGKSIFDFLHPEDLAVVQTKILTSIEKQQPDTAEFRYRHRDGYYLWMETNGSLALGTNGEFTGAVFASRDVSERRWMQRAMLEQEKLLVMLQKEQELSALKTRMMSRLSHELRTPLAVISTSADLLDTYGKRMTEVQRAERLQQIKGQIKHFTGMLDNMSLVVKGISYSMDFAPDNYNFETTANAVIKELKELLHVTHTVDLQFQGDMSVVNSDEQLMRLIMTHLLANAFKYSSANTTVTVVGKMTDEVITLSVQDHGIGILPQDHERIFEPFFRGTNIGEIPGLGIGLSIVKDAVDSMKGKIEVTSEPGNGTTVFVEIPLGGVIGLN